MKPLDVISVYSNPIRWNSRLIVHKSFEEEMVNTPGVRFTTVECAYGERPFELEDHPKINRIRVRANTLVWNKENLINIGISRLPEDWKYVAWVDADVFFRKRNWALETVQALQLHHIVQPWSDAYDLGPNDDHLAAHKGFVRQWRQGYPVCGSKWTFNGGCYDYPHPGYAWAATRQAINWLGGLLEIGAVGAGDHHMALSLLGKADFSMPGKVNPVYYNRVKQFESRAREHINESIHFIWGTIEHMWHGRKADRKYLDRWDILMKNNFNPDTDLKKNTYGVLELAGNKVQLSHDLVAYFNQRQEDANTIS